MLVTPVATVACTRRHAVAALVPVWALFVLTTDRTPGSDPQVTFGLGHRIVTLDEARGTPFGAVLRSYRRPGIYFGEKALGTRAGPFALPFTVSQSGIGMVGYSLSTRVRVLDWLGLADPMTAHFELTHRGLPGHEKPIPGVWAAAELTAPGSKLTPGDFRAAGLLVPLIPRTDGATFARQVATVRRVLRCPTVRDFASSYQAPLTAGDFLSNIADSVSNSSFAIPPAPAKAERALCR